MQIESTVVNVLLYTLVQVTFLVCKHVATLQLDQLPVCHTYGLQFPPEHHCSVNGFGSYAQFASGTLLILPEDVLLIQLTYRNCLQSIIQEVQVDIDHIPTQFPSKQRCVNIYDAFVVALQLLSSTILFDNLE